MANNYNGVPLLYYMHFIATLLLSPIFWVIIVIRELFHRPKATQVQGEVAVITGAARGLGREYAIELAKRGCHIAVVDILEDAAKDTANFLSESFNVKAKAYKVDISDYQQLNEFHSNVVQDFGDVTILINNAAILAISDSNPMDCKEIQKRITVNFTAQLWMNQLFLPRMKELNHGHIMAISSIAALITSPYGQIYGSCKSAVRAYMACLRTELKLAKYNIKVLTVMPTFLNTNHQVLHLVKLYGFDWVLPTIDGDVVAKQAVEAMLHGLGEITLPRIISLFYKLMELWPTWLRDFVLAVMSPKVNVEEAMNFISTDANYATSPPS
ncbi:17-beta-hydroxysteroid dehydrogenase 13 [Stomoxys calcitrans]|uniref:17-beta-hydroxysteroid dehydrogenase 13 n=1 Tax=Stomoxys calcitrans TaxID=35570 RepID=UPI0027E24434|nr:17-beta-hydroxysteroid dehydrogenase 13 [Stomoxys calcitrans]